MGGLCLDQGQHGSWLTMVSWREEPSGPGLAVFETRDFPSR